MGNAGLSAWKFLRTILFISAHTYWLLYTVMSPRVCVNNIIMILIPIIYSMCDFNYNYIFYCMTRPVKITANTVYNNNSATRYFFFFFDVKFIELQFFRCIYTRAAICRVMCLQNIINYCFKNTDTHYNI